MPILECSHKRRAADKSGLARTCWLERLFRCVQRTRLEVCEQAVSLELESAPVLVGHGVAASMYFERAVSVGEAIDVLSSAPGVQLWGDDRVPTPLDSAGIDDVLVGRVRRSLAEEGAINLWAVGDNLRKGAALNAVQLAERVGF